ncbi:MAG: low affinity iron permease family protein [Desulfobacterales bacterium]
MKKKNSASRFTRFAKWTSRFSGHPVTFSVAVLVILTWAVTGPIFGFSDTWQLVINTGTTIVTFLMVFLIQNTQNRDTGALQVKLDEVIRALDGAHNALLDLEELDDKQLDAIRKNYQRLATEAREHLLEGLGDTDAPEVDNSKETSADRKKETSS